jgi:hypothetical protein
MINVKAQFGHTYRITLDESAAIPGQSREDRLWLYQIPGKFGHVYVHGAEGLGAYASRAGRLHRLLAIPGVQLHQRGDGEGSVIFPVALLPQIAEILQLRRRPVISDERRQELRSRMASVRESLVKRPISDAPRDPEEGVW